MTLTFQWELIKHCLAFFALVPPNSVETGLLGLIQPLIELLGVQQALLCFLKNIYIKITSIKRIAVLDKTWHYPLPH